MDIVTHGLMGYVLASPFMANEPAAAGAFMLGSVLPDLDAFSRIFGKRAFLKIHQTYSHSIPVILAIGGAAWVALSLSGIHAPLAPPALALGMLFHSFLDVTNTYGITLWAPFSRRRFCTEWVFFIDLVVVVATLGALIGIFGQGFMLEEGGWVVQAVYAAVMAAYWLVKILLRRRAKRLAPEGTLALLPSALVPWQFLGSAAEGEAVRTFRIDARSGAITEDERTSILDARWMPVLSGVPELVVMRSLSPAYHVVDEAPVPEGTRLSLKDLRTRNFSTRFGELEVVVGPDGGVVRKEFHV